MSKVFKKLLSLVLCLIMMLGIFSTGINTITADAAAFSPRLTAPSYSTYYKPQSSYNPFKVNYNAYGGNCTWYAWGRAYEITGSYPKLGTGNAGTWWGYNKNGGYYSYGSTPKLGSVACWSNSGAGHVGVVEQINSDGTIVISESGWNSCYFRTVTIPSSGYRGGLNFQGFIYLGNFEVDKENPIISNVYTSNISSDSFTINCTLSDNTNVTRVWLNIYGPSGNNGYEISSANGQFSHKIYTSQYGGSGEYSVHIYAFDSSGNSTSFALNNIFAISDSSCPVISNVYVSNISDSSFTVNCTLNDDIGITRVWLNIYGAQTSNGYAVEATNGLFSHTIYTSDYDGVGEYTVHIYAFDSAGNSTSYNLSGILAKSDIENPTISNVYTSNVSDESFTINCTLNDNIDVTRVWLNVYGKESSNGYSVSACNGSFSHTIYTSDYDGAGEYTVHIYAFDSAGNSTSYNLSGILAKSDVESPTISNVYVSNVNSKSFTINCNVNDNMNVSRIWLNVYGKNSSNGYSIEANNGFFSHTINTSDYDGAGEYTVHIYVFDEYENSVSYYITDIYAIDNYMLIYNANGGTGAPSSQSGATSYTISSTRPTKSGYTFLGWSTNSSATSPSYVAGNTITLSSNTTLYAVWKKNANTSNDNIKITIRNNPGTMTLNYGDTVRIYADAENLPAGAKIGWYVNDGSTIKAKVSSDNTYCEITATGSGTVTLAAKAVDANGNVMTDSQGNQIADVQKINTKSSIWLMIVSFFKNLFGSNRTTVQFFKKVF